MFYAKPFLIFEWPLDTYLAFAPMGFGEIAISGLSEC